MVAEALAKLGAAQEHLHLLPAWRENPDFDVRQWVAIAWAEALTRLLVGHRPSEAFYAELRAQFSDLQLAQLTTGLASLKAWNRDGVAYQFAPPCPAAAERPWPEGSLLCS